MKRIAPQIKKATQPDAVLWFAYPKLTGGIATDINRDTGWEPLRSLGYDTVAAVAIDDTWSALRFRQAELIKRAPVLTISGFLMGLETSGFAAYFRFWLGLKPSGFAAYFWFSRGLKPSTFAAYFRLLAGAETKRLRRYFNVLDGAETKRLRRLFQP